MAITYTWMFEALDVFPTQQAFNNVVNAMHWRLIADDANGHTAQAYGLQTAGPLNPGDFIPYNQLTAQIVQGWCETQMGSELSQVKAQLVGQINQQINPTTITLETPW